MGRAVGGDAVIAARIAAAPGFSEADGHALAGFVDAEGTFGIRPNNGGTTWTCAFAVKQRADDADVLLDLATVTGIGRLHPVAAQRISRPQVTWSVNSKLECRELVRLLRRFPLRGRKRREFEVWADAVDMWAQMPYDRSRAWCRTLAERAEQLRALRRYVDPSGGDDVDQAHSRPELWWFLGGFFSGEGCFRLGSRSANAAIHLRRDDLPLLTRLARATEVGSINEWRPASGRVHPTATWRIGAQRDLGRLVDVLDVAGLRGRKRREFAAWRMGVLEVLAAKRERRRPDAAMMAEAKRRLVDARAYRELDWRPTDGPAEEVVSRMAFAELLRRAAAELDGPLTGTAYARLRARHEHWPTRNTIALAFGSWAGALRAAGLEDRLSARARHGSVDEA